VRSALYFAWVRYAGLRCGATGGRQAARILRRGSTERAFLCEKIKSGVAAFFVRDNRRNKKSMTLTK